MARWLDGPSSYSKETLNNSNISAILECLESNDLIDIDKINDQFTVSDLGQSIFSRHGAFNILHSYHNYFENIEGLFHSSDTLLNVDRVENVYGSGKIHQQKYFADAIKLIDESAGCHIDIACGDGSFLKLMNENKMSQQSIGIDLSEDSIDSTKKTTHKIKDIKLIQENGLAVHDWFKELESSVSEDGVISLWFFLHEISKGKTDDIIHFFQQIYEYLPHYKVLICENVLIDEKYLKENSDTSLVPEFLLFHKLSNQGVLSWKQFKNIQGKIPYTIEKEIQYNQVGNDKIPSSFIWYLKPKLAKESVA